MPGLSIRFWLYPRDSYRQELGSWLSSIEADAQSHSIVPVLSVGVKVIVSPLCTPASNVTVTIPVAEAAFTEPTYVPSISAAALSPSTALQSSAAVQLAAAGHAAFSLKYSPKEVFTPENKLIASAACARPV